MRVLIRGAGDLASGIAYRLKMSHISVVMTDILHPMAIRRTVAFSEAVLRGRTEVEGLTAQRIENWREAETILPSGVIPVLVDPEGACIPHLQPDVVVDAILAKRNLGTKITDAPVVIGVGPGFYAGRDCHAVVETMRGHTLGRVIWQGEPLANTAVPGLIGGFAGERVLRAPADGVFHPKLSIGVHVETGDAAAVVDGQILRCTISGVLRGILPEGTVVTRGVKVGDVDPRDDPTSCNMISDKALAVGGGVLEAILHLTKRTIK